MRHRKRTVKLSRTSAHKKAMLRNLVCSLILNERVRTSKPKAKAARSLAEKVIHLAVSGRDTATRRRVFQLLGDKETVKRLFDEVAGRFTKNTGGYTRIVPYGNRKGDNAEMVFFLLAYEAEEKRGKKSTLKYHFKQKKREKQAPAAGTAGAAEQQEAPAEEARKGTPREEEKEEESGAAGAPKEPGESDAEGGSGETGTPQEGEEKEGEPPSAS